MKSFIIRAIGDVNLPLATQFALSIVKLVVCLDHLHALPACHEMEKVENRDT